jgi:hypothetical protein
MNQKVILIGITLLLSFFTALQVLLMTHIWDPSWNPYRSSPEQLLLEAFQNLESVESAKTTVLVAATLTQDAVEIFKGSISVSSNNQTINEQVIGEGIITGELKLEGVTIEFDAEYRVVGDKVFFKINTFPFLSYIQAVAGIDLSDASNQWIVVDTEDIVSEESEIEDTELQNRLKEIALQLLNENKLITNIRFLPNEPIEGTPTDHIGLTIEKEALIQLVRLGMKKREEKNDGAASFFAEAAKESLQETLDAVGDISVELWIGKKDTLPRRVRIAKDINTKDLVSDINPQIDGVISVLFQIDITDYNRPIRVDTPENAKTIEEVFGSSLFGESLFQARSTARDARRNTDIRQIALAMEIYHLNHGQYLPSTTMPIAINGVIESFEMPTDPGEGVCADYQWVPNILNPQSYCVYACLEDGGFFMASPRGVAEIPVPPPNLAACES